MEINIVAVLIAAVAMFAVGGFWYMVPFAKIWGTIHGFDKLSKKEQDAMSKKMGPYYGAQIIVTLLSAWALGYFIAALPGVSAYLIAFILWLGFLLPANVSAVIFGGTEPKYMNTKILIMSGGALLCNLAGALVLTLF